MQIDFPLEFDLLDDVTATSVRLAELLVEPARRTILLTGTTVSHTYAEELIGLAGLNPLDCVQVSDHSVSNVYAVERALQTARPDCILAVGGGRIADFAKRLAYIANVPLVLAPTIIANDGLISPIAVLQDHGKSVSLPGKMPDEVLIDLSIIARAPVRYMQAAACDLISNLTATNDWVRAAEGDSARMHHLALQFARMAAFKILDCRDWDIRSDAFVRSVVYGQMLSGIAMVLAGSSRPCSGSEHLISHALDSMGLGRDSLHGEKVGITSRFCLHLQQQDPTLTDAFFSTFAVPRVFPGCADASTKDLLSVFRTAREMRPGRTTILDKFSDEDLAACYTDYIRCNGEAAA